MNDGSPDIVLMLFVNKANRTSAENNLRHALRGWSVPYHLAVFDVQAVPELAERFCVVGTPTLICEQMQNNRTTRLIGEAEQELIRAFVCDGFELSTFDTSTIPFIGRERTRRA